MASREPPVIDVSPLLGPDDGRADVARAIDVACRDQGFFSIVGHGIDPALLARLELLAREFFALDETEKAADRDGAQAGARGGGGSRSAAS